MLRVVGAAVGFLMCSRPPIGGMMESQPPTSSRSLHDPAPLATTPGRPVSRLAEETPAAVAERRGTRLQRVAAWTVHLYTASGTVLALLIVLAAIDGDAVRALWLGLAALVVDGTDGMLARSAAGEGHAPVVRRRARWTTSSTTSPTRSPRCVLLWTAGYLPNGAWGDGLAALPLLASSYQFCRVDAKTDDHFFLGFPSYWNVVAFYVVVLGLGPPRSPSCWSSARSLVFVPVRLRLPLADEALWRMNLRSPWSGSPSYAVLLAQLPDPNAVWSRSRWPTSSTTSG